MTVITAVLALIAVALSGFLGLIGSGHAQVTRAHGTAELAALAAATAAFADHIPPCEAAIQVTERAALELAACTLEDGGFVLVQVQGGQLSGPARARAGPVGVDLPSGADA